MRMSWLLVGVVMLAGCIDTHRPKFADRDPRFLEARKSIWIYTDGNGHDLQLSERFDVFDRPIPDTSPLRRSNFCRFVFETRIKDPGYRSDGSRVFQLDDDAKIVETYCWDDLRGYIREWHRQLLQHQRQERHDIDIRDAGRRETYKTCTEIYEGEYSVRFKCDGKITVLAPPYVISEAQSPITADRAKRLETLLGALRRQLGDAAVDAVIAGRQIDNDTL